MNLTPSENPIRIAEPDELRAVFDIGCALHRENGQHKLSEIKCLALIHRCLIRDRGLVGVIGPKNDIRAMICLTMEEVYYSDDYQLVELWNYVRPDCRKSDFAKRLIEFAKKCATETELDLTIGIISNERMKAKCRLYGRLLPKAGEFYVWSRNPETLAMAAE